MPATIEHLDPWFGGREGVRYAMEEMSQLKFTGIRLVGGRG